MRLTLNDLLPRERENFRALRRLDRNEGTTIGRVDEYILTEAENGHALADNGMSMTFDLTDNRNLPES